MLIVLGPEVYLIFCLARSIKGIKLYLTCRQYFMHLKWRTTLKLIMSFLAAVTLTHNITCIWYHLAVLDGFSDESWVVRSGYANKSLAYLYLASFNFSLCAMMSNVSGNVHPLTEAELVLTIIWIFIGLTFLSYILSQLISVLNTVGFR